MEPPVHKKKPGRPKIAKIKKKGETATTSIAIKRGEIRCTKCKVLGQNKRACPNQPVYVPAQRTKWRRNAQDKYNEAYNALVQYQPTPGASSSQQLASSSQQATTQKHASSSHPSMHDSSSQPSSQQPSQGTATRTRLASSSENATTRSPKSKSIKHVAVTRSQKEKRKGFIFLSRGFFFPASEKSKGFLFCGTGFFFPTSDKIKGCIFFS